MEKQQTRTGHENDQGAALAIVLLLLLSLSAVGASLVFLSNTETYSSLNYRLMSQARFAAESGVHKTVNHLLNNYAVPGSAGDPLANYNMTVSPVTYNGQPVVLSAVTAVPSNYPVAAVKTAFTNAGKGTVAVGGYNVQYATYATLLSMRQVFVYGSVTPFVVQTWKLTADGTLTGSRPAQVEVSAILEREIKRAASYGMFAVDPSCASLTLTGGSTTDSYDFTNMTMSGGKPVTQLSGGDVGTNGNLKLNGSPTIVNGSLSTPRSGVGSCSGKPIDAYSGGVSNITGGMVQLSQPVSFPPPDPPNPMPPTTGIGIGGATTCLTSGIPIGNCAGLIGNLTLNALAGPLVLGNVQVSGGATIHLTAGTYNFNSLKLSGGSQLVIDSGPVILNIAGQGQSTVVDLTGGTMTNSSFNPRNFQIFYAGTGTVKLNGGTSSTAMVYAPAAAISFSGNADFYGSLVGGTITDTGGARLHYDRSLANDFFTIGNYMLSTFTWKKY